jgi:putative DNA primase/helicase
MINSDQFNEDDFVKKCENIKAFRTDLKNLVISEYNFTVENIPDLLADFNRRYPGYKQIFEHQDLLNEADRLNSWGWTG